VSSDGGGPEAHTCGDFLLYVAILRTATACMFVAHLSPSFATRASQAADCSLLTPAASRPRLVRRSQARFLLRAPGLAVARRLPRLNASDPGARSIAARSRSRKQLLRNVGAAKTAAFWLT